MRALFIANPAILHKGRVALRLDAARIARVAAPPTLAEVQPAAPAHWQAGLDPLIDAAHAAGVTLRVFGSLAWQHLTGLPYLRDTSDIDLLFAPSSAALLDIGLELLLRAAPALPLDGEIDFPHGAVAWREYARLRHQPDARVLVKRHGGPALVRVAALRDWPA